MVLVVVVRIETFEFCLTRLSRSIFCEDMIKRKKFEKTAKHTQEDFLTKRFIVIWVPRYSQEGHHYPLGDINLKWLLTFLRHVRRNCGQFNLNLDHHCLLPWWHKSMKTRKEKTSCTVKHLIGRSFFQRTFWSKMLANALEQSLVQSLITHIQLH